MNHGEGVEVVGGKRVGGGRQTYQLVHGPLRVAPRGRGGAPVGKEENFHHIAHGRKEGGKEGLLPACRLVYFVS